MKRLKSKIYKDEDDLGSNYLEDKYNSKEGNIGPLLKTKKEDIRQLEEFIGIQRPKDPFKDLDPLVSKVDITAELKYHGIGQMMFSNKGSRPRKSFI